MLTQPRPPAQSGPAGLLQHVLGRRRPSQDSCAYDAAMTSCAAACDQLAAAPDPWVRHFALCQLLVAHQVASMVATDNPWPTNHGGDGRTVAQVHQQASKLINWLAVTEHTLAREELFNGQPMTADGGPLPARWADVLTRLCAVADPYMRARLVIEFSLTAEPGGGPVADVLHEVALAYLELAGERDPGAVAARLHPEVLEDLRRLDKLDGKRGRR